MARTSRRETKFYTSTVLDTKYEYAYRIGLYGRYSVESAESIERDSIGTQMIFLEDFAKTIEDSTIVDRYIDDDVTGTTFERPEYERLMSDIDEGKINCIVVKDLSRFARNHLNAGEYLERIFPEKGVRFIAITDNLDTLKGDGGIIVPVKNVINELYARDTSQKLTNHFHLMQKNGDFCSWKAPYGYVRSEDDKHKFDIDEEAAFVVKRIFDMYAAGDTLAGIAKRLDEEGVLSPMQYAESKGAYQMKEAKNRLWTGAAVKKIVSNQSYLGDMVQNKFDSLFQRTGRKDSRKENDKSDWIIVKGMHQPIISEKLYKIAQDRLAENVQKRKELHQRYAHIPQKPTNLKGLMKCGCCGASMVGVRKRQNNKFTYIYQCPVHDEYGRVRCVKKSVKREELDKTVFFILKRYIDSFLDMDRALEELDVKSSVNSRIEQCKLSLRNIRSEIQRVQNFKGNLYEDLQAGMIDESDYTYFIDKYKKDLKELENQELEETKKLTNLGSRDTEKSNLKDCVKKYANARKLSPEMANAFIENVVAYEDGSLDVTLKMKDEFDELAQLLDIRSEEEVAYAV